MADYGGIGEQEILDYLRDYRDIEVEELEYLYPGESLEAATRCSVKHSDPSMSYSVRVNGVLNCIGGVVPTELGGQVWFLATNAIKRNSITLAKELASDSVIDRMLRRYGKLYNYISMNNVRGIQWIKHIGFTVHEPDCDGKCYFERILVV